MDIQKAQIDALVEKAQKKDDHAMERIINIFHPRVFTLVSLRVKRREDARDISQDVFIKAWKNIQQLQTPSKFKPWLFAIADNRIKDFYRKKRILSFLGLAKDYENLSTEPFEDETCSSSDFDDFKKRLKRLTVHMSRKEKDVFMMRFLDNLTIDEIAIRLNNSPSSVKTHLYRGLKKIKENEKSVKAFMES